MSDRTPAEPGGAVVQAGDETGSPEPASPSQPQSGTNETTALLTAILTALVQTQDAVRRDVPAVEIVERLTLIEELGHRAGLLVLKGHLRECLMHTGRHGEQSDDELLVELHGAIARFVRSLH
jgi:DNA-binding FrmR family transcriptional regulator